MSNNDVLMDNLLTASSSLIGSLIASKDEWLVKAQHLKCKVSVTNEYRLGQLQVLMVPFWGVPFCTIGTLQKN